MIFWLVCAAFVGIGLAFVLPPLLQRQGKEAEPADNSSKEANVEVYRDQLAELERERSNGLSATNSTNKTGRSMNNACSKIRAIAQPALTIPPNP